MSRVDQAFRRASGRSAAEAFDDAASPEMGYDLFPAEERKKTVAMPDGRRARAASGPTAPAGVPTPTHLGPEVGGKVVIDHATPGASIEEYRRLAATLHLMQAQKGLQALIVSSALPRDGKTLTSTNLALTLSESYKRRVLLVDADLRRPALHDVFGLSNVQGLADGLRATGPISLPFMQVSNHLTVLPAGRPDASPMAGLTSERMRDVIADARERFDWVIVDTPPVGLISDASLLASLVDGVLLVIGAGATPYDAVKRAVAEFGRERIIGVVLNRVVDDIARRGYYREYYQASGGAGERE
ncbi:MAG: CpsD/CapB family tyrosine-protein kinase [Mycobacteriales bacterium]